MDYVGQLREGILEAYTGLVSGFKGTDKGQWNCASLGPKLIMPCSHRPASVY
jgi:hypothetical protein